MTRKAEFHHQVVKVVFEMALRVEPVPLALWRVLTADIVRRASTMSTMSERLDYHEVTNFLRPNLEETEHNKFGSTPEVCIMYWYMCVLLFKVVRERGGRGR